MAWNILTLALRIFWRRLGLLLSANVIWLLASLPLVTLPAATAGLFALVGRVLAEELEPEQPPARLIEMWHGARRYGLRATLLVALDLAVLLVIGVALQFYGTSPVEVLRYLIGPIGLIGLAVLAAQLYVMPLLLVRETQPVPLVMREALLMAIGYPAVTISLGLTLLVITLAAAVLAGPILLVYFAFLAVVQSVMLRDIRIRRGEIQPAPPPEALPGGATRGRRRR